MRDENFLNSILTDWAARSPDGLLSESLNEDSLEALHATLMQNGLSEEDSMGMVNDVSVISEKGKHPERQAYNKNGLLVTFPTPDYKARAISKGTHFEKNPKVAQSNLFGGGQQAPNAAAPAAPAAGGSPMDAGSSTLPQSDSQQAQTPPAQKEVPDPGTPGTPAAPAPAGTSAGSSPSTDAPAQGQLATEPPPVAPAPANVAPPAAPPTPSPVQKTPQEIAAEKEVIKQIMNQGDTLPTVPGVSSTGVTEELRKLTKVALEMNLNEAVRFLSQHI
jgi:hypothetical protein